MRKVVLMGAGVIVVALVASVAFASASQHDVGTTWGGSFARSTTGSSAAAALDNDGDQRLVVVSRNESLVDIDNPPEGFSQGDEQAVSSPLYDPDGGRTGFLDVHVLVTFLDKASSRERDLVTFTSTLPGGQLEANGVFRFSENRLSTTAAITGGTGRYDDVGGDVLVEFLGDTVRLTYDVEELE